MKNPDTWADRFRGEDPPAEPLPLFSVEIRWEDMTLANLEFWMTVVGTICWGFCFWWMGRISSDQNRMIDQIREQGRRIEKLSKVEHDLIKEVHPKVGEIREGIIEVIAAVKENSVVQKAADTSL